MAETPLVSDILASNPTLDVNATRFSAFDTGNINRVVAYLSRCIPFYKVDGQGVEVRGHQPDFDAPGPSASFYDEFADGSPDIPAGIPYVFAAPTTGPGPTRAILFKHIASAIALRDFSTNLLSKQYNYEKQQRQGLGHAVWKFWNQQAIVGSSTTPSEFDGLDRLIAVGLGQSVSPSNADPLDDVDQAMDAIRSHERRVDLRV